MGGVEPPSKAFSGSYATCVVALLSAASDAERQASFAVSQTTFGVVALANFHTASTLGDASTRTQAEQIRRDALSRGQRLRQRRRVDGCHLLVCPFLRSLGRFGTQRTDFQPCRNQTSPGPMRIMAQMFSFCQSATGPLARRILLRGILEKRLEKDDSALQDFPAEDVLAPLPARSVPIAQSTLNVAL